MSIAAVVRARVALSLCALAVLLTAACGSTDPKHDSDPFNDDSSNEGSVHLDDRPSMETILDRYRDFQTDLFAQLAQHFGQHQWTVSNGGEGLTGTTCDHEGPGDFGRSFLPTMVLEGTYPAGNWAGVRDLVINVGKRHGFTQVDVVADVAGDLDLWGRDPRYGGAYEFGMGRNTVFGLNTGCHRWDRLPTPGP